MSLTYLRRGPTARLRTESGRVLDLAGNRWVRAADGEDQRILSFAEGPALDLGCGPGRHAHALAQQGVIVLGIDLSTNAVELARTKRLAVLERSVFDVIPKAGHWATALLLDGNVGIGGDPERLLNHVASILRPGGIVLVDVPVLNDELGADQVRLELDNEPGPWFSWAHIDRSSLMDHVRNAEMTVERSWTSQQRYFAVLRTALR